MQIARRVACASPKTAGHVADDVANDGDTMLAWRDAEDERLADIGCCGHDAFFGLVRRGRIGGCGAMPLICSAMPTREKTTLLDRIAGEQRRRPSINRLRE